MKPSVRSLGSAALFAAFLSLGLSATAFAQSPKQVTLRYLSSHGGVSPHELADELGYYNGLEVKLKNVGYSAGGPESLFGLASGSVDVGSAATAAVINAITGGNDFVAAYPSSGLNDRVKSIFYVLDDSPIRTMADIRGKTIAVNTLGAHLDYAVREASRKVGLPKNAVKLVVVPGPQLEQTLRSKQVDIAAVGYWQSTFNGLLVAHGGVRAVFDDTDILGDLAGGFTVLRRDFVKAHPKAAHQFIEQAARAADWSRENLDEARKVFARILKKRGENADLAQYWVGFGMRKGGVATDRDVDFWIKALEEGGRLPKGKYKAADILYRPGNNVTTE